MNISINEFNDSYTVDGFRKELKNKIIKILNNNELLRIQPTYKLLSRDSKIFYYAGKKFTWTFDVNSKKLSIINQLTGDVGMNEFLLDEELTTLVNKKYEQLLLDEIKNKFIELLDD